MAPKRSARDAHTPSAATPSSSSSSAPAAAPITPAASTPRPTSSGSGKGHGHGHGGSAAHQSWDRVFLNIASYYSDKTPQRTKLVDAFMAFLAVVGALQFVYCVLAGNYPFNAFLSGFAATVGQFVLTASLRIQTTEANKADFPSISPERAFADYIVCSLILHFFCVNFVN